MKTWAAIEKNPFRIFFPLGAILAFAGVVPWLLQYFGQTSYPRELHRTLMINGFLLSFVSGFLMTAIPRFTATHHATKAEILFALCALVFAGIAAFFPQLAWNFLFSSVAIVSLGLFAFRRFLKKTANPPSTFVFIGIGLLLWLVSDTGQCAILFGISLPDAWSMLFQDLFSNGAIMSLILGVGGRLIPGILGWQDIVTHQRKQCELPEPFLRLVPRDIWICLFLFLLSFILEPLISLQLCFAIRGVVALYFGIKYWIIYRFPKSKSFLTWSVWLCCWCLALGYFLPAFASGAYVHSLHLLFIGGFSLLTLLISTRVTFAHSPVGTAVEKTSPFILTFSSLVLLSMMTRVTAALWPEAYLNHLGYAAIIWIVGLIIWGIGLFTKTTMSDFAAK